MATNYEKKFEKDYQKLQNNFDKKCKEYKYMELRAIIAEDTQMRLEKQVIKKENEKKELKEELKKINEENKNLKDEIFKLQKEIERLKVITNNDGTTTGIPTSMTPIGKKKVIPNTRVKSGEKIGRKVGHKKDKLERIPDDKINEVVTHTVEECPDCHEHKLEETGKIIEKDEKDYKLIVINRRHQYKEYRCTCCGKIVHEQIPNYLKEECQYGSNIKSLALTLTNIGNVPFNRIKRIINGLTMEEINPSEGYLVKLQKQASKRLESFVNELRANLLKSQMLYWDDTVIIINGKQGCMRYYGNDFICLYKAHEKKNKEGLDKDNILNLLNGNTVVEHDHNKVNYNPEYGFINAECCQHLIRDLRKVKVNIPSRVWCDEVIELFQKYNHQRKELIEKGIETFGDEEINEFILKLDMSLLKGIEENESDESKPYYSGKELTLIYRIIEYRDNYIYWILDFSLPFTNNLSERNLRGIKSKMKVSGQFQNIERAKDYANIRSYIETCRLYGKNEYDALTKLVEGKPYTFTELYSSKNK